MELQDLLVVNVNTLDKTQPLVKVTVPAVDGNVEAGNLHKKVCNQLGLKESSLKCFSLFKEDVDHRLLKRIKENDILPVSSMNGMCIRKWCFNLKLEQELLLTDEVATHLLYLEAENLLENGKLLPTKEQEQKLDELSEPGFILERQFVEVCHNIKDYFTVCVKGCRVTSSSNETLNKTSSEQFISPVIVDKVCNIKIPWFCIRQWTIYPETVKFSYHMSVGLDWTLSVSSDQTPYLVSAINEMLKEYQVKNSESAAFHWSMVSKTDDGATLWENAVFDQEKAWKYYNT
ncbi:hypothetical protein KUTeg_022560 [Tegillarca granosa]|uniref:Uncharacterized protein n=1 Tax=Tegillarca granosa TaxID=220873 RepID=A0ABQ9E6J5_TEGGR|nr:hypothetical protein KUTeg_022560 [Tegillarca granosa]